MRPDATASASAPRGASLRAVLLALLAVGLLSWITPYNDYDLQNTYIAGNLFPQGAMVVLLALVLAVNPILRRVAPRQVFRPAELGLIWGIIAIASGIPAAGFLRYLLTAQTAVGYYATPENRWATTIVPHLKPWMVPVGSEASTLFYSGSPSGLVPWAAWRSTLLMWFALAAQIFAVVACLTVILRRQWVERERFSFPLVQLPMALATSPSAGSSLPDFLRHRLVWAGAAIPILIHGLNGIHLYFPGVPQVDLHYDIAKNLPSARPWNAVGSFPLHIFFATIGFAYLLAQEIAFSMWFFRFFEVAQRVVLTQTNLTGSGADLGRFANHQAYGAVLALGVMVAMLARPHLRDVWQRVRHGAGGLDDSAEAMRYRTACWGLALSCALILATFLQWGLTLGAALVVLVVGLLKYVAASWGAANAGLMMVQQQFRQLDLLASAFGSRNLTPSTVVNGALIENVFWYDLRETLMPSLLNAAKLSEETGLQQRQTFRWGFVAIALATGVATVAWLQLSYDRGGTQLAPGTYLYHAQRVWNEAMARLDPGQPPSRLNLLGTGLGAALFLGLMALRLRFVGWPLHPIGLVTMTSWTSNQFGVSFFVGWALKAVIVKTGGLRLYARLRPFFLGVVLGDVIIAVIMTVVGFVWGQGYFVTPN
ncbi:MAG: hypothetical protein IT204_16390 [Fimbriimonadaceae bacterium]|nr:hypothetical protein [Fimbriimonadaceae bacterium]